MEVQSLATMGQWLDNIAADSSGRPLPAKIAAGKPGAASDACFAAGGTRHQGSVTVGGTNFCSTTFPAYSLRAIFPDGVYDYSGQSQYAAPFQGTWLAFG